MEQEDKKKKEDALTWDDVQEELNQSKTTSQVEVKPVVFEEMAKDETVKGNLDLKFILDIPLNLTVELGRTRILISELLQLGQGSVIELTKLAGEPMDIYVNNRLIARGEVVVVNEKFGVRLTDIISPTERVTKLG
ncbi:MAG: flagellar motor switch protein FliN [Syntrophales bacterium]|nr:flagellar motor switch protein FliN [Syntrophales bacterium]